LHRYNNQDHSMLAGRLAARELLLGEYTDLWNLNTDEEYLEERPQVGMSTKHAIDADKSAVETIATR